MKKQDTLSESPAEIRFVGDLQRLELKPGDRFVLTVPRVLSQQAHEHIRKAWRQFVGGDDAELRLLVLEDGMKIGVIGGPVDAS